MASKKLSSAAPDVSELETFGKSKMLHSDPEKSSIESLTTAYAALNFASKAIESRLKALKPVLHAQAEARGEVNEKGSNVLMVGPEKILRERKLSSAPNTEKVRALLETKGIALDQVFDEVKIVAMNPSKLDFLVQTGKLKSEEVEALREESFALKVTPGKELEAALEAAFGEGKKASKRA